MQINQGLTVFSFSRTIKSTCISSFISWFIGTSRVQIWELKKLAKCKESGFQNPGNLLLVESGIGEICRLWIPESRKFVACGIRNPGNLLLVDSRIREICCLWNPKPGSLLLVESRIRENCCLWILESGKFVACGFRNPGNLLLVDSGIREICCLWISESGKFVAYRRRW